MVGTTYGLTIEQATRSARFLSEKSLDAPVVLSARRETPSFDGDHKRAVVANPLDDFVNFYLRSASDVGRDFFLGRYNLFGKR